MIILATENDLASNLKTVTRAAKPNQTKTHRGWSCWPFYQHRLQERLCEKLKGDNSKIPSNVLTTTWIIHSQWRKLRTSPATCTHSPDYPLQPLIPTPLGSIKVFGRHHLILIRSMDAYLSGDKNGSVLQHGTDVQRETWYQEKPKGYLMEVWILGSCLNPFLARENWNFLCFLNLKCSRIDSPMICGNFPHTNR